MIKYLSRHNKDYSRYNIIKSLLKNVTCKENIYILLPFSKNQFIKNFLKKEKIINDFFISNFDTYVYDRKKISKYNPRAWWKYFQDWINFKFSRYLLSDTYAHFLYWEKLFGKYTGKLFVLPVLADTTIYYPAENKKQNEMVEILFYGSFIPLHGIDIILKAFKILEEKHIQFKAKIIGNGQMYKTMLLLFQELNLKNVQMSGELISELELANEIRNTDIVLGVFGSSIKANSVVPNKVYQALACQKPIITMKSNAIKEFFDNKSLVVCDNTPQDLADSLASLIHDQKLREKIAFEGKNNFLQLYNHTQEKFKEFVLSVEKVA